MTSFHTDAESVFACYSKACAPPPVGRGGSSPKAGSKAAKFNQRVKGGDMTPDSHSRATGAGSRWKSRTEKAAKRSVLQKFIDNRKQAILRGIDEMIPGERI